MFHAPASSFARAPLSAFAFALLFIGCVASSPGEDGANSEDAAVVDAGLEDAAADVAGAADAAEPDASEADAEPVDADANEEDGEDAEEPDAVEPDTSEGDVEEADTPDVDAPECEDADDCGTDTDCVTYGCVEGECVPSYTPAGEACDDGDVCDGAGSCVPSELLGNGDACEADAECSSGFCTEGVCCDARCDSACGSCLGEVSGGTDGACLAANAGDVCRPSLGLCDPSESCDGASVECPADVLHDTTVICRADLGSGCDVAEACTGSAPECPGDSVAPAGATGNPECLNNLLCDGSSASCPTTCFSDAGCRAGTVCVSGLCITPNELSVAISEPFLSETDTSSAFVTVSAARVAEFDIEVTFTLTGTASEDDVVLSGTTAVIPARASEVNALLTVIPDRAVEDDETVTVTIATSTPGAVVGVRGSASTVIVDDDVPYVFPARDSLEWMWQDVVTGDPTADPYCHPATEREEARINTPLGFVRTDAAGDEGGISVMVPTYNPERQRWEQRSLTTFDFRPYAESQPGVGGIPNGADVFEGEGQYVSIVGTNDSGGVAGWASNWGDGCQFFDGWISYEPANVPDFDPSNAGSWASLTSPIEGVSNPTRDNCPAGFGSTTTRWTYVADFTFAADSTCPGDSGRKVMDTIVSDHDGGNHHEVFYFTDEYGSKSRWERWECGIPYPDSDYITARCRYSEAQSVMHMAYGFDDDRRAIVNPNGDTCYMVDCRDFTSVEVLEPHGYRGAAWHYGAAIYFSGNILRNGDFNRGSDDGWDALNTVAEIQTAADSNRYLRISTDSTGWHSVFASSIDEFNRFFDAGGEEAFLPKYLHWGARVRHDGSGGTARLALIEWGNPSGQIIDERGLALTDEWQWVEFHRILGAATNSLDLRFRLDELAGLEVDDVYIYISNEEER